MRLATFNVLNGRSLEDGEVDLDRFAAAVRSLDADVLGLQEVDRDQPRSHGADLTAVAAEAMGADGHRFAAAISGTPGGTWVPAREQPAAGTAAYGVALLSRFPVRGWQVVRLPALRISTPVPVPGRRLPVIARDEPRVAVVADVESPYGPMTVVTTHLSFVPAWNVVQLCRLLRRLPLADGSQVLMGDLNIPGPLPRVLTAWRPLATLPTYPAAEPRWQLDHVLARGPLPPVRDARAPRLPVSDHRPLVVDL